MTVVVTLSSSMYHVTLSPVRNKNFLTELPALANVVIAYIHTTYRPFMSQSQYHTFCYCCLQHHPTSRYQILLYSAIATEQTIPNLRGLKQGYFMSAGEYKAKMAQLLSGR